MLKTKTASGPDKIRDALTKLKDESNAKELELIELVASVYETVKEKRDEAVDKAKDAVSTVNTSVHLHPWCYIGGAAVCGLLAGLFLRR